MPGKSVADQVVSDGLLLRILSIPVSKKAVLVCGLPGSGYVGKLGADHLIGVFKAKKVAEYYSNSFPPQVNVKDDGKVNPIRGELYFAETGQPTDLFIFTADAQPTTAEGEYELSDAVLELSKKQGVGVVYTLAAYITGGFSKVPKVLGACNAAQLIPKLTKNGVQLMKEGGISGMNGILIGLATLHKMDGICLLGETSGYLIDAGASESVLEMLSKLLNLRIDLATLRQKAEETQQVIGQLQKMSELGAPPEKEEKGRLQPGYIS